MLMGGSRTSEKGVHMYKVGGGGFGVALQIISNIPTSNYFVFIGYLNGGRGEGFVRTP